MSFLPNMRLLALPSDALGEDWFEKGQLIDQELSKGDWEVAEESTYLFFSASPEDVLNGDGQCLVARSIIGPKREVAAPWILNDWTAAPVWQGMLKGQTLSEKLANASELRASARKELKKIAEPFILCVRRKLVPELVIETFVLFN